MLTVDHSIHAHTAKYRLSYPGGPVKRLLEVLLIIPGETVEFVDSSATRSRKPAVAPCKIYSFARRTGYLLLPVLQHR